MTFKKTQIVEYIYSEAEIHYMKFTISDISILCTSNVYATLEFFAVRGLIKNKRIFSLCCKNMFLQKNRKKEARFFVFGRGCKFTPLFAPYSIFMCIHLKIAIIARTLYMWASEYSKEKIKKFSKNGFF